MERLIVSALAMVCCAALAQATPYWIAYEGDALPEDAGWQRRWGDEHGPHHGGAERTVEGGILTLDGLRHDQIFDLYEVQRPINPGPGELFVAEWRVRVDPQSDPSDVGIVIARDELAGHVELDLAPDHIFIAPGDITIELEVGVFHTYWFASSDMESFELTIDETIQYSGWFETVTLLNSFVNFGDAVQGEVSLSQWDYFRFGVVPEPTTAWTAVLGLLVVQPRRRCCLQ